MHEQRIRQDETIELDLIYGADKVIAYDANQEPIGEPAFFRMAG